MSLSSLGDMANVFVGPFRANREMPVCPECGERWHETPHPFKDGQTLRVRIPCPHQEAAFAEAEALRERQRHYDRWVSDNGHLRNDRAFSGQPPFIPLDQMDGRESTRLGLGTVRRYLEAWPAVNGKGLTFHGSIGSGKTTLAYGLAKALDAKLYTVVCITEDALLRHMRTDMGGDARQERTYWACVGCDLLILDEMGERRQTEWAVSEVFEILHARHERGRPMVLTTNHTPETLWRHYRRCLTSGGLPEEDAAFKVGKIASRLGEVQREIAFVGKDGRKQ